MRVCVCPADLLGSGYYRMAVPYLELARGETEVAFVDRRGDLPNVVAPGAALALQCPSVPWLLNLIATWRRDVGPVVVEMDDNVHALPSGNARSKDYGTGKEATRVAEAAMRAADLLIVSTRDLADEYRRFNANVAVCENAVEDRIVRRFADARTDGAPKRDGEVRIGWAGGAHHEPDLTAIAKPLAAVLRETPNARLVFVGDDLRRVMPHDLRDRCEFAGATAPKGDLHTWHIGTDALPSVRWYDLVASADLDIALAPVVPSTFNRQKSALKLIEYGMLGVPALASSFGPYARYVREAAARGDGEVAALAWDAREWLARLRELIGSAERRAALACANRAHVAARHVISVKVEQWEAALRMLREPAATV